MPVKVIVAFVLFVRVNVCALLVTPTGCTPKSNGEGATTTLGIRVSFATNAAERSPVGRFVWNAGVAAVAGGKTGKVADEEKVTPVT
jgi:hypothetical protein